MKFRSGTESQPTKPVQSGMVVQSLRSAEIPKLTKYSDYSWDDRNRMDKEIKEYEKSGTPLPENLAWYKKLRDETLQN
ncbi:MAG TPA: hypothetical protein VJH06_03260 [Candidatus Paceibacterota bacterium]